MRKKRRHKIQVSFRSSKIFEFSRQKRAKVKLNNCFEVDLLRKNSNTFYVINLARFARNVVKMSLFDVIYKKKPIDGGYNDNVID